MSSATWTPRAVGSEAHPARLALWRAVEAQHVAATRALIEDLAEQEILESILEAAKPPRPARGARLDYLLYTPFRYAPPPGGSRFRGPADPGVWYGAETMRTGCAELGYWRWRFVRDSHGLTRLDAVPHTVFQAFAAGQAIDLRTAPLLRDRAAWSDPSDYGACQRLARSAREAGLQIIRYASVRDPEHAGCAAVLDCRALVGGVRQRQTWFLTVDRRRASWVRAGGQRRERFEFRYA